MASKVLIAMLLPLAIALLSVSAVAQLEIGFYSKTCPKVEEIVRDEMVQILKEAPTLAGPLLRLHFHDCFVRGCDGSVLLDSTKGNLAEKDAKPNKSLRGFSSVERIKSKLEEACPNTVSCADIVTLMSRDAVVLSKGPSWPVALGRRDGSESHANETKQLPPPTANITKLTQMFAVKGLDLKDLVVLSGAHTLGTAHCSSFSDRLYNFTGMDNLSDTDPSLDNQYLPKLRSKCKSLADNVTLAENDPGSFQSFDNSYYKHVSKRRGLFHSDAALLTDSFTKAYVQKQATGMSVSEFFTDFVESMIKMGNIEVLTGSQGVIRKKCYVVG